MRIHEYVSNLSEAKTDVYALYLRRQGFYTWVELQNGIPILFTESTWPGDNFIYVCMMII